MCSLCCFRTYGSYVLKQHIAGLGFLLVRLYANSTLVSILAHIGTNSVAMLGSLVVVHLIAQ